MKNALAVAIMHSIIIISYINKNPWPASASQGVSTY